MKVSVMPIVFRLLFHLERKLVPLSGSNFIQNIKLALSVLVCTRYIFTLHIMLKNPHALESILSTWTTTEAEICTISSIKSKR